LHGCVIVTSLLFLFVEKLMNLKLLQALLNKIDFLSQPSSSSKPSVANDDLSMDEQGFPNILLSPCKKGKLLVHRKSDESNLSLDSKGFPSILKGADENNASGIPLLSKLELAMKVAAMKKPSAARKTISKAAKKCPKTKHTKAKNDAGFPLTMKQRLKSRPDGCSKCRGVPGCTPSCWKARGWKA
jgi:hypothetical protein